MNNETLKKVEDIIIDIESSSRVRRMVDNEERLKGYHEIGRLLVEAQGGASRAKYGDNLIKKWGEKLAKEYGKNYDERELRKMRQFYLIIPKCDSLSRISWTHIKSILPIKNENERNYYINQVILNNLSVRELRNEIKSKSFERLSYADKNNIKLITENNNSITLSDMIKDPIIIKVDEDISKLDEATIHKKIINYVENRFMELGVGFALVGHEYKIRVNNKTFRIDLLFFNYELNAFVVVEVKNRVFHKEDIGQLQFYTNYVNSNLKKYEHRNTLGLLIVREKDDYVIKYVTNKDLFITTFKLENNYKKQMN